MDTLSQTLRSFSSVYSVIIITRSIQLRLLKTTALVLRKRAIYDAFQNGSALCVLTLEIIGQYLHAKPQKLNRTRLFQLQTLGSVDFKPAAT